VPDRRIPAAPAASTRDALRARLDAAIRPLILGAPPEGPGAPMTARRIAAAARDAADAALATLPEPRPSAHRVRRALHPVLTCGWAEFDAAYDAALDAILALPAAVPGVQDPPWDAGLVPAPEARRGWMERGQHWDLPALGAETVAPGGTVGRVASRGAKAVVISGDGRPVRIRATCACEVPDRASRPEVAFEHVHLRRDGSILDVTVGSACALCRAPIAGSTG
jgi:hypothetical protein